MKFLVCLGILICVSCNSSNEPQTKEPEIISEAEKVGKPEPEKEAPTEVVVKDSIVEEKVSDTIQNVPVNSSLPKAWKTLVDIQSINPKIKIDLKYATADNFVKRVLYDTITKVYLQKDVAVRLGKCQEYLTSLNSNLFLLVYDGVRPVSVQRKMWVALDTIPVKQRVKFVSNPANGSIHNYGAAVDLTLCDQNGMALDMGAGYDDIRKIAYPRLEAQFLASGELTEQQVANRKMLRKVMSHQNFRNISTEWWHFNACTRQTAKAKYYPLK